MKKALNLLTAFAFSFSLISCEESTVCDLSTDVNVSGAFYSILNDTLEVDTVANVYSSIGVGSADSLSSGLSNQNSIDLELNPFQDTSSFVVVINNVSDTLTFKYNRSLELLSELCGFITTYEIEEVKSTYHVIDSLAIIDNTVINENELHLKIYL